MFALVATPRFLLLVDLERRSVVPIESDRPEYYGISWFPGGDALVLSHSGVDSDSLVDLRSYALSEVGFLSVGSSTLPRCLSATHQILCGSDGRVICANTGRNCVTVLDPSRPGHFQEAMLGDARWDRLSAEDHAGLHVNSVFEKDGLLHVLAHGFDNGSRLATFRYPSMDLVSFEPLPGLTGLHNYCITADGARISCHSNAGTLVDPLTGHVHWRSGTAGYLRGLAVGPEVVLVGDSPKQGRNLRAGAVGGLWVIDRADWIVKDYLVLGPYGTVNEVRLLDVADEAHHGNGCAGGNGFAGGSGFAGLKALLARDLRREIAERRIAAAGRAREAERLPFERVAGTPEIDGDDRWISTGDICLIVLREPHPRRIAVGYDLTKASAAEHCSLVIGHDGDREAVSESRRDSNMDVLLVKRGQSISPPALSHWTHDGSEWRCVGTLIQGLPESGTLAAERDGAEIVVWVDARESLRLPLERFARAAKPWGFRWQGTAILPEAT